MSNRPNPNADALNALIDATAAPVERKSAALEATTEPEPTPKTFAEKPEASEVPTKEDAPEPTPFGAELEANRVAGTNTFREKLAAILEPKDEEK